MTSERVREIAADDVRWDCRKSNGGSCIHGGPASQPDCDWCWSNTVITGTGYTALLNDTQED